MQRFVYFHAQFSPWVDLGRRALLALAKEKKLARHAWQISAVQISLGSRVKILLKLTMCKMEESSLVR